MLVVVCIVSRLVELFLMGIDIESFFFFSIFFFPTAGKEPDHPDYLPTDVIAYLKDVTEAVEGGTQTKPPKELTSRIPTNTEGDSSFYDVTKINTTKYATSLVSD